MQDSNSTKSSKSTQAPGSTRAPNLSPGSRAASDQQLSTKTQKLSTKTQKLSKGEQTRLKILRAALRVIARSGPRAVTHRGVAKEAAVSLSLTTYYFKDLSELLIEAFRLHKQELHDQIAPNFLSFQGQVELIQTCRAQGDREGLRASIHAITEQLSDFMIARSQEDSQGLMVEMAFFFDLHMPDHFRQIAYELRQRFVDDVIELATQVGSDDPVSDAELIVSTVQRLQLELRSVPNCMSEEKLRRQLQHLVWRLWRD
ncbi:TetR family transcriptional regulator [Aestuariicella hydrocarbonica]|uniref:TetR family transcriptional regulator n=1 Tax=Pseudomaricurvus hydrocarbonicus TaxID=1470433 RepID=A0A9E5JTC4_9GAMM|nr:TetR family transcriptional regulator [Aestuariicella hydrocarbonica]NHO65116.1 TetR family transcriptional regulator [Aestuariicella hydrocarbonica]